MPTTITIRPMSKKELAGICDCSYYQLSKSLALVAVKFKAEFKDYKGVTKLTKTQVKIFLQHCDLLPEVITLND